MRDVLTASVIVLCGMVPTAAFAQTYDDALIKVTIGADAKASGTWTLPSDLSLIGLEFFTDFGSTGLLTYTLTRISNDTKELFNSTKNTYIELASTIYTGGTRGTNNYVTYDIFTALQSPLAIYEIWIPGAGYYKMPKITISIPAGSKVLTSWPAGTQSGQTFTIHYNEPNAYAYPAMLILQPPNLGPGNTIVQSGRFTLVGSSASVQKLQGAISEMPYLDKLFEDTFGAPAPSSIILYAADLSQASVGYEAEALAARPNLVLYNQDILSKQSKEEVQSVIVHELVHIHEMSLQLMRGGAYLAPWFKEGMAVLAQIQARPYIYKNSPEKLRADDLLGRTRMFSADQLKQQYQNEFDLLFQGTFSTNVGDAYTSAGVVMNNYYQKVGASGMKKLLEALKPLSSAPFAITPLKDSDTILNNMSKFSGIAASDHLMPYKNSAAFDADVAKLVYPKYSDEELALAALYIQNNITKYFQNDSALAVATAPAPISLSATQPVAPAPAASAPSAGTALNCSITLNLRQGMRDSSTSGQVTRLQKFLASKSHLKPEFATGFYGALTVKAVQDWQRASGIASSGTPSTTGYGAVGPKSRAALATQCQ